MDLRQNVDECFAEVSYGFDEDDAVDWMYDRCEVDWDTCIVGCGSTCGSYEEMGLGLFESLLENAYLRRTGTAQRQ